MEYSPVNLPIDDAGHLYETDEDTWIADDNGNITASKSNGDFDRVLSYGDGYYMLYQDSSGFDEAVHEIGIMKYDGTWSWEYGTLNDGNAETICGYVNPIEYIGEGVFVYYYPETQKEEVVDIWVVSCSNHQKYTVPNVIRVQADMAALTVTPYDKYLASVVAAAEYAHLEQNLTPTSFNGRDTIHTIILNIFTGEILADLDEGVSEIGEYSDGGFVYEQDDQLYFFDCSARDSTAIYLEDADKFAGGSYQFIDGEMEIRLNGADGNTYYATVDKSGNYITEPHLAN